MSKKLCSLSFIALSIMAFSGCNKENDHIQYKDIPLNEINDKYRSVYQIMPYSYADSDGDGVGDLKGITAKVDYIASLNYTSVWLTPVHPSPTYHKYDVTDYKAIDRKFGTLTDYDELVSKLHDNGMTMIMDLVVNHSSDSHTWFTKCKNAHRNHQPTNQYYNYYNMVELNSGESAPSGYSKITGTNIAYESRFWSGMPDLNLQNVLDEPNGYLANELKDIFKFWLVDHNVDGFRLDAVTSYFTGEEAKNTQFLKWLNDECKKVKPSCYIVGEGAWGNPSENKRYQSSGVDSFFMFSNQSANGYIAQMVMGDATYYPFALKKNKEYAAGGIEAPFVANHDTGHMIGAVKGRSKLSNLKFGHGCLAMLNGTTFTYYGDEMGLAVPSVSQGKDEDKRLPIDFGDEFTCSPVSGHSPYTHEDIYPYGSVKDQLSDSNSCVNYVKKANLLRKQFPQIARGTFEEVFSDPTETLVAVKKTYNNESIYVVMNASPYTYYNFSLSSINASEPLAELCAEGYCKLTGDILYMPAQSIVILK